MFRGSARSLLDQRSRQTALRTAAALAVIGATTLIGCLGVLPMLCRWFPGLPAASVPTALGLLAFAAGFRALAQRGDTSPIIRLAPVAFLLLLGGGSLLERLFGLPVGIDLWLSGWFDHENPGAGLAAFSAASLVLGALGLWAITWPHRRGGSLVSGICGMLLGVAAIGIIVVYATNLVDLRSSAMIVKMSAPAAVSFLLAGVTIVRLTWRKDTALMPLPGWAAIALGMATMVSTLLFWFALSKQETEREERALAGQAEATRVQVIARLDETISRLCQLGNVGTGNPAGWPAAVGRSFAISPGLEGVALDHESGPPIPQPVQARTPEATALLPDLLTKTPAAAIQPEIAVLGQGAYLHFRVPVCGADSAVASTQSLWRAADLLRLAVASATPAYVVALSASGQRIMAFDSLAAGTLTLPASTLAFTYAGIAWRLDISPGVTSNHLLHPAIPGLIGVLGILVSLLLTLTVGLLRVTVTSARQSERERLARGLESTTEGLWEWHARTGESLRSRGIWERLGYDPDRIPAEEHSHRWIELVPMAERVRIQDLLRAHLDGRTERFEAEYPVQAHDGTIHWIADRGRIVERDTESRPTLLMGISTDVTDRRLAEEARAATERQFRAVFDSGYQLQWLLDPECHVLEANRTALEFAGMSLEEVWGHPFWATPWWAHDPEGRDRLAAACTAATQGKAYSSQEEMVSASGRSALIDFSLTPIRDDQERITHFLAEARDITERKRTQDALREMDALSAMGRVAARVAHEINNPLAGIQNAFLLIKNAIPSTHPHFGYVGAIEREISRIAAITRQLYETYRPEKDPGSGAPAALIISDAVRLLEQVNRKTGVRIEVDVSGTPGVVPIPASLLRQAIYNLVQNAIEASPPDSVVIARTWRDADGFWLSVRDHGRGIPLELRESIFRPFVTTKADLHTGGMGLGLSLVRRSVSTMNGRIEIIDPPDGGTEIRVFLPITPPGDST